MRSEGLWTHLPVLPRDVTADSREDLREAGFECGPWYRPPTARRFSFGPRNAPVHGFRGALAPEPFPGAGGCRFRWRVGAIGLLLQPCARERAVWRQQLRLGMQHASHAHVHEEQPMISRPSSWAV